MGLYPGGFYPPLRGARYLGQRPLFGPFESCMGKVCPQRSPCGHVRVLSCAAVPKPSTALRRAGSLIRARHCASARSSGTSALPFALLRWIPREGRFEADSFLGSGLRSTFRRNAQCRPSRCLQCRWHRSDPLAYSQSGNISTINGLDGRPARSLNTSRKAYSLPLVSPCTRSLQCLAFSSLPCAAPCARPGATPPH